jgi:hypothetical protein
MATVVAAPRRARVNSDRYFFSAICLAILVIVWLGFSKTYYAAGLVKAPLPATIIHVHAVVFTLWLVTLIVQIGLVSARKVKLHMTVGLWGFGLALVMPVVAIAAAVNALRRDMSPPGSGLSPYTFFIVPLSAVLLFSLFAGFAYALRRRPDFHKRLILFATFTILDAAFGRFPQTLGIARSPLAQTELMFILPLAVLAYDLISRRAVHRATWIGLGALLVEQLARIPLAQTAPWQAFAKMVHG